VTVYRYHELGCDGCVNAYAARAVELYSAAAIRAGAKAEGWKRRNGRDLCPSCAEVAAQAAGKAEQ
jgi:hypothetical protein